MRDSKVLIVPAVIKSPKVKVDNTISFVVDVQELGAEEMTVLFQLSQKAGWFLFSESVEALADVKVPDEPVKDKEAKSLSEQLRNIKYVRFEKEGGKPAKFNAWYDLWRSTEIEKERERLRELED
jgi:hypothetical protein